MNQFRPENMSAFSPENNSPEFSKCRTRDTLINHNIQLYINGKNSLIAADIVIN